MRDENAWSGSHYELKSMPISILQILREERKDRAANDEDHETGKAKRQILLFDAFRALSRQRRRPKSPKEIDGALYKMNRASTSEI